MRTSRTPQRDASVFCRHACKLKLYRNLPRSLTTDLRRNNVVFHMVHFPLIWYFASLNLVHFFLIWYVCQPRSRIFRPHLVRFQPPSCTSPLFGTFVSLDLVHFPLIWYVFQSRSGTTVIIVVMTKGGIYTIFHPHKGIRSVVWKCV